MSYDTVRTGGILFHPLALRALVRSRPLILLPVSVLSLGFREGHAELCDDGAATDILEQEGCIIAPGRLLG